MRVERCSDCELKRLCTVGVVGWDVLLFQGVKEKVAVGSGVQSRRDSFVSQLIR